MAGSSTGERSTFNDQERDLENGLFDLSDRNYSSARGAFTKVDRLWEKFMGVSPYAYCNGNPLRLTDPDGMQTVENPTHEGGGGAGCSATEEEFFSLPFSRHGEEGSAGEESTSESTGGGSEAGGEGGEMNGGEGEGGSGGTGTSKSGVEGSSTRESTGFSGRKGFELKNRQVTRNDPTIIDGRTYTGHALDQMQNRGIVPSLVDNAIKTGIPFPGNQAGTVGYYDPVNSMRVIVNSQSGSVVTVMWGKLR